MTDKQKIRAEVERLKMEYDKESIFRTVRGDTAREVFGKLLSFIDSLAEESANSNFREELGNWYHVLTCDDISMEKAAATIKRTALHFCEWKKLQMMKDAADSKITTDGNSIFPIIKYQLPLTYDCKIGDKVKLIIIKED